MKFLVNIVSGLFNNPPEAEADDEQSFDFAEWNRIGRAKAQSVCIALEAVIDRGEDTDEDFTEDERSEEFADAVLDEVVALNEAGKWQEARMRFDPAHEPFVSHMGDIGLHAVVILAPESFLVRLDDKVLHINGGNITPLEGAYMFGLSRNRQWLVMATESGLAISKGLQTSAGQNTVAWPEGIEVDPSTIRSLDIADDGRSVALASDECGIWLMRDNAWTVLAPRPGVGDENEEEDGQETSADAVRNMGTENCPVYLGSYAAIKARFGGPLGIDASHTALSPDGKHIAYGWQDAWGGHYVDRITETAIEPLGRIEARSDYPYNVRFTDDSSAVLSNARYSSSGVTVCCSLAALTTGEEQPSSDEYLRAYNFTQLPGIPLGVAEPVVWIGGAGWSHAAPLSGGKPVFTHFLGSALRGFDFDPVSKRVAIASASGVLHILDPFTESDAGLERGYHPRRELFRWIFWETLEKPIRW